MTFAGRAATGRCPARSSPRPSTGCRCRRACAGRAARRRSGASGRPRAGGAGTAARRTRARGCPGPRPAIRWSKRVRESVISSSTGPSNCTTSPSPRAQDEPRPAAASGASAARACRCPTTPVMRRCEWIVRPPSKRRNRCLPCASTARTARPASRSGQRSRAEARVRRARSRRGRGPRGSGGSGWPRSGSCRPRARLQGTGAGHDRRMRGETVAEGVSGSSTRASSTGTSSRPTTARSRSTPGSRRRGSRSQTARGELRAIVITHAHVDHLGFARARAARSTASRSSSPRATRSSRATRSRRPSPSATRCTYMLKHGPTRRLYWRALRAGAIRGKTLHDFTTYGDGDELPGGLRAVARPATLGHMALHLPERDVLFAGDAIVTRDPYTDRDGPVPGRAGGDGGRRAGARRRSTRIERAPARDGADRPRRPVDRRRRRGGAAGARRRRGLAAARVRRRAGRRRARPTSSWSCS